MIINELIPPSWVRATLEEVVQYGARERAEPGAIPISAWVLELEDIEKNTSRLLQRVRSSERPSKSTKNRFSRGDILYGKLRPYLNKVIRADEDGYCTTEIVPIRVPPEVDPDFLLHWLKSPAFAEYVDGVSHGLTMPRLGTDAAKRGPCVLAPLTEQFRISEKLRDVLTRIDRCREHILRIPPIVARLRHSVLSAATSGALTAEWRSLHAVSDEWKVVKLSDVASSFSYGSSAKSSEFGEVPVLRMGNIQDGRIDWSDLVYTSEVAEIQKYRLVPGDVLFNRTNSPELVGKTAVYHGERDAVYAGYLVRVRCGESILPDYLSYSLNSPTGREYCQRVKSDGVSQSNVNAKKLAAFTFALPTLAEQREIVERVGNLLDAIGRLMERYRSVRHVLDNLVPALLHVAYKGELVPQDPQDEPASALLTRIKAGRATRALEPSEDQSTGAVFRAPREKAMTTKSRSDVDVFRTPYLASLLRAEGGTSTVVDLFRRAELPVADFYKQLAWEVEQKHISDSPDILEAL
jgi:type I restriction enzyme S subunit